MVDMRGADPDDKQLRDDLMTMLIAGGALIVRVCSCLPAGMTFMVVQCCMSDTAGGSQPLHKYMQKLCTCFSCSKASSSSPYPCQCLLLFSAACMWLLHWNDATQLKLGMRHVWCFVGKLFITQRDSLGVNLLGRTSKKLLLPCHSIPCTLCKSFYLLNTMLRLSAVQHAACWSCLTLSVQPVLSCRP